MTEIISNPADEMKIAVYFLWDDAKKVDDVDTRAKCPERSLLTH
jgi:hypothetical protein